MSLDTITSICQSGPSCMKLPEVLNAAANYTTSICTTFPNFNGCQTCSLPITVSSCADVVSVYQTICSANPALSHCSDYTALCTGYPDICDAVKQMSIGNGTNVINGTLITPEIMNGTGNATNGTIGRNGTSNGTSTSSANVKGSKSQLVAGIFAASFLFVTLMQ